jgi:hypothetical protein
MPESPRLRIEDQYASAVRALLLPPGVAGERGIVGAASAAEIESRSSLVLSLSDDLTRAQQAALADADPLTRARANQRLLAKAATELEISAYLKEAGDDQATGAPLATPALADRSAQTLGRVEAHLRVLAGAAVGQGAERGRSAAPDLPSARVQLITSVGDACDQVAQRAGDSGKKAFESLLSVGLTEIGAAAGALAAGAAGVLGVGESFGRLYDLCRDFIKKMYDTLLALIGDQVAKLLGDKIAEWVKDAKDNHVFGDWLAKAYGVDDLKKTLATTIAASGAELTRFSGASDKLDDLVANFGSDMDLTDKVTNYLGYLKFVPGLGGPHGLLFRAAAYCLVLGWAVLDGADYLDAGRMDLINRIPGVRSAVVHEIG